MLVCGSSTDIPAPRQGTGCTRSLCLTGLWVHTAVETEGRPSVLLGCHCWGRCGERHMGLSLLGSPQMVSCAGAVCGKRSCWGTASASLLGKGPARTDSARPTPDQHPGPQGQGSPSTHLHQHCRCLPGRRATEPWQRCPSLLQQLPQHPRLHFCNRAEPGPGSACTPSPPGTAEPRIMFDSPARSPQPSRAAAGVQPSPQSTGELPLSLGWRCPWNKQSCPLAQARRY